MEPAAETVPYLDFAIALFLGGLVGIEREKSHPEARGGIAGIRTFMLFAEAGAVAAWTSSRAGTPWVLAVTVASVAALAIAGHVVQARAQREEHGLTTGIAAIVVCLLGAAVTTGHRELAVALGITTSALLAFRVVIHGAVARIGEEDLYAGLKLLLATFVILPLVPNRTVDPWDAVNPYRTWWLVILIAGLSFLGYVAVRVLGARRGFLLTGLFGGLVSSTAVTLSFAKRSRDDDPDGKLAGPLAAAVLIAWSTMFARIVVTVAIVHSPLVARLWLPMSAMGAVAFAAAFAQMRHAGAHAEGPEVVLKNPFRLMAAVQFALLFTVVLVLVRLVRTYAPDGGVYGVAAFAGLTDVDAISLSMAEFAKGGGAVPTAVTAIVIAAIANTLVKTGMAVFLGSRALRNRVATAAMLVFAAGAATLLV